MTERHSNKHGPRADDELEHEVRSLEQGSPVESRVQEHREQEPAADTEPVPDELVSEDHHQPTRQPQREHLTAGETKLRSALARSLTPSVFPADRDALLDDASSRHTEDELLDLLRALPPNRDFRNLEDVWETIGGRRDHRG